MFTATNYSKIEKGKYKSIFYLNNRDHFEIERDFVKELNILIERFSRDLEDSALVVKAYEGDIANVRKEILSKPWKQKDLKNIHKTPGLLMIDVDFKEFNPNQNNWIYFYFLREVRDKNNRENAYTIEEAETFFIELAEVIKNTHSNLFKEVKALVAKQNIKGNAKKVIDFKPSYYGISLNVKKFSYVVHQMWKVYCAPPRK